MTLRFDSLAAVEDHLAAMAQVECETPGLSELDHALQCAAEISALAPEDEALQVGALLHDVGHGVPEQHDRIGAEAIRPLFGARVAAMAALHVRAKRYLVATDPGYRARLSFVSIETLALQGGAMSAAEVQAFEAEPFWRDAVRVRIADEAAKVPGRAVPGLGAWRPILARLAAAQPDPTDPTVPTDRAGRRLSGRIEL